MNWHHKYKFIIESAISRVFSYPYVGVISLNIFYLEVIILADADPADKLDSYYEGN